MRNQGKAYSFGIQPFNSPRQNTLCQACTLKCSHALIRWRCIRTLLLRSLMLIILGRVQWNSVSIPTDPRGEQQAQSTKNAAHWLIIVPRTRREGRRKGDYAPYHTGNRYQPQISLPPYRIPRGLGLRALKVLTKILFEILAESLSWLYSPGNI